MLGILGGLIAAIPGLLPAVLGYLKSRSDVDLQKLQTTVGADRDVMIATLQAQIAANNAKASIIQIPAVRFLFTLLYLPVIVHAAVIVLGRIHFIEWDVLDFLDWEKQIALSLVILVPSATLAGGFTAWLHK